MCACVTVCVSAETVRPLTKESCDFVTTMLSKDAKPREKLSALQKAAARHVRGYTDAMCGQGIDRHLFALYVVSVGKAMDSPFLKGALSVPWKLSTSQQPQQQTTYWDIKDPKNARRISPGGGFGPVAEDGYGVSYMVSGERELFFHISSKRAQKNTDSKRFAKFLFEALGEMKDVLTAAIAEGEKEKTPKAITGTTTTAAVAASPAGSTSSSAADPTPVKEAEPAVEHTPKGPKSKSRR